MYPPYNNNNKDNNHNNPISSRLQLKPEKGGGDFVRLNSEAGDVPSAWGHEVVVQASGRKEGPSVGEKDGDDIEMLAPPGGIRVKTEITLTREKRIDYLDRLY